MNPLAYDLNLEGFSGPLDKLLMLVAEKKLPINDISLAQVTNDFLNYIRKIENIETPFLADFIVIASRLILIKSKSLLPDLSLTEEEQEEIKDLKNRLSLYRELKPGMKVIAKTWASGKHSWGRSYLMTRKLTGGEEEEKIFYPGSNVSQEGLRAAIGRISSVLEKLELETETIKERIISVEEKIKEIVERLSAIGESSLRALSEAKPRAEVIAIFLALLHLAREQLIFLEQTNYFSDIMVKRMKQ